MRGQVLGLYREKEEDGTYSQFFQMNKYDWKEMDEYETNTARRQGMEQCVRIWNPKYKMDSVREFYIVNTEEMDWEVIDSDYYESQDDIIEDYMFRERKELLEDDSDVLDNMLESWLERNADIARGK
jgi:hypothetical protein